MVHSYCKEICAFTIVAVPLLSFLKNYLPKKFKLNETGDLIEQLNYYHTFIKKTKYFYKKLAQRLQDMVFASNIKQAASLSDLESGSESLIDDE
jgi:hypothetical protein